MALVSRRFAFANTAGGLLVIGVENGTKRVRGLLDPLKEEERLASLISDQITLSVAQKSRSELRRVGALTVRPRL